VPFDFTLDFQRLQGVFVAVVAVLSAVSTALWLAMIIWTFRDMRARSRDVFAQALAALVVAVLNVPGLLVYLILRPPETLAEQYERSLEEEALLQEIEGKPLCPGCGHTTKEAWRVCPYCHTKLRKECQHCGELLDLSWTLCPYCGKAQQETAQARRPAAAIGTDYDLPSEGGFLEEL
jgi:RNA polymerase subunit RPABC4/transcription elongation factor Spt4